MTALLKNTRNGESRAAKPGICQQGEMPAFSRESFATEAELVARMKELAPLSHWRLTKYDA